MISAVIISTTSIESLWPNVKHYIELCDGDISTSEDLYTLLLSGERLMALAVDGTEIKGAGIYRVVHGFNKKVVITTLGGNSGDVERIWSEAIDDFARQLKSLGFGRLEVQGRRAWKKELKKFTEMHTTIGMDL